MTFSDQSAISAHYVVAHGRSNCGASRPEQHEAKYPCEICGKKFTQSGSMYKHVRTVHGVGDVKTYRCDVCSRVFKMKHHLTRHVSSAHGLDDV